MKIPSTIAGLRAGYLDGRWKPAQVGAEVMRRVRERGVRPVWIELVPEEKVLAAAAALEQQVDAAALPLYGVPFAVKDNIDVAGMPTTAGCPAYAYTPARSATVVERLQAAGALFIGKTNLDQFATGLNGTRSPYGAVPCVFDEGYIAGGSSSGSAVAVAAGLVSFALGTDTAGSGRVPAALNNIVGLKPTRGALSTLGVVPACRTLDCVSVVTLDCGDARSVLEVAQAFDAGDPFSRVPRAGDGAAPWLCGPFRFGVPGESQLEFFGDTEAAVLFEQAVERMRSLGGEPVEIDYAPFRAAAELLYAGPWVAERYEAIGEFCRGHEAAMDATVEKIVSGGAKYSAAEFFAARRRLAELERETGAQWARMDVLLLPTAPTTYTIEAMRADPIALNSNLGYYTNFVNLLDLAAVAAPAGLRAPGGERGGLPFGVSLIGRAWSERALLDLGAGMHQALGIPGGVAGVAAAAPVEFAPPASPPGCVLVAVVGAHLSGQPLNNQLTSRGARLQWATRTASCYRLYALAGTQPAKPGLVRDPSFTGPGIEVEVWAMPEDHFGGFVAEVPAPLGIGTVELENKKFVKCFICEPHALAGAIEITSCGGWRAYLRR